MYLSGMVWYDDNSKIIAAMDGSRVEYDKLNTRTEITITDFTE